MARPSRPGRLPRKVKKGYTSVHWDCSESDWALIRRASKLCGIRPNDFVREAVVLYIKEEIEREKSAK